jgi:uncharacterized protein YjbJ (UPF0337 family)
MGFLDKLMGRGKKAAGDLAGDASLRREGMHQEQGAVADEHAAAHEEQAAEARAEATEHRIEADEEGNAPR